ncbi:acetyl-CoA hydrolase/transferase family protein [Anaeromyxobacter terrae]|uniref:acetyl-CoA hydrolase/transferase family protein n=1 Tax=Anaeromyxobacter terrae TaxID=2925406 RepID=UPI001F5612BF|nr:acetyl-CoA hydrolase/transferase C-terminal domain-containing protein [Anaeromyxobacter sp. SG22]
MATVAELYRERRCTPAEAAAIVRSGDQLVLPICAAEPTLFVKALGARKHELSGVVVHQQHTLTDAYLDRESAPHVALCSWFTSAASRSAVQGGWADFVPNHFHEVPRLLREHWPVDVLATAVSPMDEEGFFTCGLSVAYTMEALRKARKVVVQVNPAAPRTRGDCRIHVSQVDRVVECEDPLFELTPAPVTAVERAIGGHIAELIEDGSTLQLGIGGIPNAVCAALTAKRDLGIHTEMLTDGVVDLVRCGAVNNSRKTTHPGASVATFALGTRRLYDFMHENPAVEMHPVDHTNDPYEIGRNDRVVAINATLEVDLLGQCCSEAIGPAQWSGSGGQVDFVRGANLSRGGKSFIAAPSTARQGTVSRIVAMLEPGAVVTTGKNDVDHVVTEYGVAKLRGRTARQRALALIAIAHPDFRRELTLAARRMNRI